MNNRNANRGRRRPGKGTFVTKSGATIKLHKGLTARWKARKEAKARQRAAYLGSLPKNRFKRILYRLHPKRLAKFWFSREGALMSLKIAGIGIVVGFVFVVGLFAYFRKDLPNINDLSGNIGGTVTYYDRSGETVLFQDSEAVKRIPVSGDQISQLMKNATIAIEDKDFYKHGAFDLRSIVRAGVNDVFNRSGGIQGGSTISQQLVKLNQDWTNDRTIARKVKELILAVELEREYSKDEILNGYLNVAPYGGVLYGVESAARDYFGTTAKDLTLSQAALLAGMPKSPTFYSPYNALADQESREALIGRQHYILDQMVDQGMVTREQADEAQAVDILAQIKPKQTKYQNIRAPYFVLAAKNELEQKYGSETVNVSGWKVTTTLDLGLQELAEREVQEGHRQVKSQLRAGAVKERRANPDQIAAEANIAFGAMDVTTAQMVALVGGTDFTDPNRDFRELNYASYPTRLPPGSSFKPYDYMAMIEHTTNTGAGSVLYDIKAPIPGYAGTCPLTPAQINRGANCAPGTEPFLYDYDSRFPGPLTLRYALAGSRNIPAVKAMLSVVPGNTTASINKTIETAEAMGLRSGYRCYTDDALTAETQCYASSAIGDGAYLYLDEHVNGFATMSRLGNYLDKTYILKIVDDKGKTVDEWKQKPGEQVIRPDAAYITADMLSDPRASYMSRKAQNYKGWKFALKTGTTNDNKDGWMMGASTKYAAGVWVGHGHRQVAFSGFMETMTLPIWQGWMNAAHDGQEPKNWEKPSGVQTLPAYIVRSHVGGSSQEPSPDNDLFPSWYQKPNNSGGGTQTIDKVSEKLATSCTPELAKETRSGGSDSTFSADLFVGTGSGANLNDQDNVHNCNDAKPSITLTTPSTCSSAVDCIFIVTVSQGTHPLSSDRFPGTVSLSVNGQALPAQNVSASPSTVTFTYIPSANGSATIDASVVDSVLYTSSQSATVTFVIEEPPDEDD
ncbi:MAG: transglycosylase domain-containing protein [Candidatus Saccharimonadales bacterium]